MPTPFVDPAAGYDDSVLSAAEIDRVREIIRDVSGYGFVFDKPYNTLANTIYLCGLLTASQNKAMRYDLDQFFNQVGEGTFAMKGGTDGVDINTPRDRKAIRNRVRERLGLPAYSGGVELVRG